MWTDNDRQAVWTDVNYHHCRYECIKAIKQVFWAIRLVSVYDLATYPSYLGTSKAKPAAVVDIIAVFHPAYFAMHDDDKAAPHDHTWT